MKEGPPYSTIILFGGGLDSGVLCARAYNRHKNPLLLYFDYGAKAAAGELAALRYLSKRFDFDDKVVMVPREIIPPSALTDRPMASEQAANEVPGRNVLFLAMAFSLALRVNASELWIGADPPTTWEGFRDSKQPTFDAFNIMTAFAYGEKSPRVYAPLLPYGDAKRYVHEAMVTLPEIFDVTFSCYESFTEKECGVCKHCERKARLHAEIVEQAQKTRGQNEYPMLTKGG